MRAVIQRVSRASVTVEGRLVSEIGTGMLVLLGVAKGDGPEDARKLAAKVAALRVFEDAEGKMNRSIADAGGAVLCVSQFTLHGDVRRGNRPSFEGAAAGSEAEPLYRLFCEEIRRAGLVCAEGVFGAEMAVELVNDGPVTLILDTNTLSEPRRA
jgi:D-tyrosyl-tRNA(Tyr) deacylase